MGQEAVMKTPSDIARFLCQHLVALYVEFRKDNETQKQLFTTCALSVSDHWFLLTAGHCIQAIDECDKNGYVIGSCALVDYLGEDAKFKTTVPFPVCVPSSV